jgi:hypothetical protein
MAAKPSTFSVLSHPRHWMTLPAKSSGMLTVRLEKVDWLEGVR